jgi:tryptophanyl-tRNA synthetase
MAPVRVFSGIQPSGGLHLGNYLGAVRQWLRPPLLLSGAAEGGARRIFSVVDLHALTQVRGLASQGLLRQRTLEMTASLLACGLQQGRGGAGGDVVLFAQSSVREHTELAWLLACQTPLGKLQRMTQFKQKTGAARDASSLGLLSYPVLQAADILLYRSTHVPVGEDQVQHLELARDIAEVANAAWGGAVFPVPATLTLPLGARVMSLRDGRVKMSKSDPDDASRINMEDGNDAIAAKVRGAKTDSTLGFAPLDPAARPEKANLVGILAALTGRGAEEVAQQYAGATAVAFKEDLVEALVHTVAPIRGRLGELRGDWAAVEAVLREGAHAASAMAADTMKEVRGRAGLW